MQTNEIPAPQQMFQHITAYWVTQLVGAAARLGVADQLEPEPLPVNTLAARVGAHPQALYRTLRACTAVGVFTEQAGQTFANNALSQTLRSNVPGSMRDFAIAQSAPGHWRPWELLTQVVRTGKSSASEALGCELWDWYGNHPEESGAFSGAMDNLAAQVAAEVTKAIDFSDVGRVVDVGGASGTLVNAVLRAFPRTKGVPLDLPHVVEPVKKTLTALGLAERCEVVAGDFFRSVPDGDVMPAQADPPRLERRAVHHLAAPLRRVSAQRRPRARRGDGHFGGWQPKPRSPDGREHAGAPPRQGAHGDRIRQAARRCRAEAGARPPDPLAVLDRRGKKGLRDL
jgi:hypothetical protein